MMKHLCHLSSISRLASILVSIRKYSVTDDALLSKPSEMFSNPRKAYESALKKHGPVIGVWRKGRVSNSVFVPP